MKKGIFLLGIVFAFSLHLYSLDTSFSIGSIGGSCLLSNQNVSGNLEGTLLDIYLVDNTTRFGLYLSPFNYYLSDGFWGVTIINATFFHETIKPSNFFYIGPFAGIQWIDFIDIVPVFKCGIQLQIRGELSLTVLGLKVYYSNPILYNYVNIEIGFTNRGNINQWYFSIKTDASILVAFLISGVANKAKDNTEKYAPQYKDLISK